MKHGLIAALICFSLSGRLSPVIQADPFIDTIVETTFGQYAGYGQDQLPDIILGPPHGGGDSAGSTHVLSLGDGGSITLRFDDNICFDGPGPDLIIFENAFFSGGDPLNLFCEPAFVEVSRDGMEYFRFPNDYDPEGTPPNNPANWSGFAGLHPVYSNPENEIDPTNPEEAGGDAFDLSDLGLDWIRYVRLIDTGEGETAAVDDDGDVIYDPAVPTLEKSGFDLDAVVAVHSEDLTTPTPSPGTTPSATPAFFATATSTPHVDMTPTPVPTPEDAFFFQLCINQTIFHHGDLFRLYYLYQNPLQSHVDALTYIVLEAAGSFYFWPGWTRDIPKQMLGFPAGTEGSVMLLEFLWPDSVNGRGNLIFWGGVFDPVSFDLLDEIENIPISYEP